MLTSMNIGGVEKSLLSLLSVIDRDKYEVTILLLEKKGGFLKALPDWVKIEEACWYKKIKPIIMQPPKLTIRGFVSRKDYLKIPKFTFAYLLSKHFNNRYFYYSAIMKDISENHKKYDVAIAYQGPTEIIDYYIAHKVHSSNKISWVHFDVSKHMVNKALFERIYKKFDKIFAVSNGSRKCLINKFPSIEEKTDIFPNIVSEKLICDLSRNEVNFDETYRGVRIVTVGRLSWEKGQDMAIRVLAKLRKQGYEVRWYCIGEGNRRKEYEREINKNGLLQDFILLGATPNPYPYIARCDIYVQPSRHEGYCLTLAEAKVLKKPIVTTNFVGAYEQIVNDFNGIITNMDEEDLYLKLKKLIDNSWERKELVKNINTSEYNHIYTIDKLF
nr:glycosyltransferase [Bacillus tianshenii]